MHVLKHLTLPAEKGRRGAGVRQGGRVVGDRASGGSELARVVGNSCRSSWLDVASVLF
jgi:hypothetical protein